MWLTRILVVVLFISSSTFPANSQDMDYVGIPCKVDNDCNFSMTFLLCLQKSNSKAKDCQCRRNHFYDRTQKKCLIGVDSQCKPPTYNNKNPQECIPTAECVVPMESDSGTCTLKSDLTTPAPKTEKPELNEKDFYQDSPERMATREMMEEEIEEQETSTSRPLTFLTVNQQGNENGRSHSVSMEPSLLGRSCTTHESCEQSRTFLKCLGNNSDKQCVCSKTASFDYEKQACLLLIGSHCNLPTDENRNPQRCVKHGKCIPNKDLRGSALTVGKCCDPINQQSCSEFREITTPSPSHSTTVKSVSSANPRAQSQVQEQSPSDGEFQGKKCNPKNLEDCNSKQTHLNCIIDAKTSKSVCQCRKNHSYDRSQKKCFIGIGSKCTAPSYSDANPQKCIPIAECVFPIENGIKQPAGTCTCKPSSTEPPCDMKKTELKDLGLYHKPCQNHNDCRQSATFLKCLNNSTSPKKICGCGKTHIYDIELKKCFLGLGSQCTISEVENDRVPKCGPNLECSSGGGNTNNMNRNINNRKSNVGSCVCRHGSRKSSECDAYVSKEHLILKDGKYVSKEPSKGGANRNYYFPVPVTLLIFYVMGFFIS